MGFNVRCVISCMSISLNGFFSLSLSLHFAKFDTFINKNKFEKKKKLSIELRVWKIEINFIMNEFYLFQNGLFTWFDVANVLKFIILSHWIFAIARTDASLAVQSRFVSKRKLMRKMYVEQKMKRTKTTQNEKKNEAKIHKTKQHTCDSRRTLWCVAHIERMRMKNNRP